MSGMLSITNAGDHVEIVQSGQSALSVTTPSDPTLLITQDNGDYISLNQTVQSLVLTENSSDTLVIREPAGDSLIIAETDMGVAPTLYGHPHTTANDGTFYYFAWQHIDQTRWKAQRFDLTTLDLQSTTGDNPQPETLSDFQNLSF